MLDVRGKVFCTLDLGKGVIFRTLFVIVKNLGVPALIGRKTMSRVGMDLCFRKPYRLIVDSKEGEVEFPFEKESMETMEVLQSYLTLLQNETGQAIGRSEVPNSKLSHEVFDLRGEEKARSSF